MYFHSRSFFESNQINNKPSQASSASQELSTAQNLALQDNIFTFIPSGSNFRDDDDEESRQSQLFQTQRLHHNGEDESRVLFSQSQLGSQLNIITQTSQNEIFSSSHMHDSHEVSLKRNHSQLSQSPFEQNSQLYQQEASQDRDSKDFDAKVRREISFLEESILYNDSEEMDVCEILTEDGPVESQSYDSQNNHSQNLIPEKEPTPMDNIIEGNDGGSLIPPSVAQIYEALKNDHSDWVFFHVLTGQMCHKLFPMGVYNNLKSALLLSLASTGSGSTPIPIVAFGKQTSHANDIINAVGKYARTFLNSLDFGGSTANSSGVTELQMTKRGVFYIGDWSGLSPAGAKKLLREFETGKVTMGTIEQTATLDCAIWTYWTYSTNVKKDMESIEQFKK